jgi:membrane protease YdiL (CAAX protease family)
MQEIRKRHLLGVSLFTLFGFSGIAYFILNYSDAYSYADLFVDLFSAEALLYGTVAGISISVMGYLLLQLSYFKGVDNYFGSIFKSIDLEWADVFFYSFCAAVGEEILFRGAIQPFLGIYPTAILFVLLHGYLSFKDKPKFAFGIYLVLVAVIFGYLMEWFGLIAPIIAHFIYDVVMFSYLKKKKTN